MKDLNATSFCSFTLASGLSAKPIGIFEHAADCDCQWPGKPFIASEWHARGMDCGRFRQNLILGLLESGGGLGWHGFGHRDNDPNAKRADPSKADSVNGIVSLNLKPCAPLMEGMREINRQVHTLASYFDILTN